MECYAYLKKCQRNRYNNIQQDGKRKYTIQAKSLTKRSPVPLGSSLESLFADYLIVCRNVLVNNPELFITSMGRIRPDIHKGHKNGRVSYWLQQKNYEQYKDNWEEI